MVRQTASAFYRHSLTQGFTKTRYRYVYETGNSPLAMSVRVQWAVAWRTLLSQVFCDGYVDQDKVSAYIAQRPSDADSWTPRFVDVIGLRCLNPLTWPLFITNVIQTFGLRMTVLPLLDTVFFGALAVAARSGSELTPKKQKRKRSRLGVGLSVVGNALLGGGALFVALISGILLWIGQMAHGLLGVSNAVVGFPLAKVADAVNRQFIVPTVRAQPIVIELQTPSLKCQAERTLSKMTDLVDDITEEKTAVLDQDLHESDERPVS